VRNGENSATSFKLGFTIVLALYLIIFGSLLWATDGLPYVFDNNETFSSIIHARNMFNFGIGETFGLTDESYGLTAASHPYLYTHQGNFPRLFALLLYWLGARSGEAQIIITTFTIGTAAILLAYDFVARRSGWAVGLLFCTVLMTDYVMVVQWQVNTWRVWHMFFFFFSLVCVDRLGSKHKAPLWLTLLLLEHAALFYYELIFAAFSATMTTLFAILTLRKSLPLIGRIIGAQVAGMTFGVGILICQLWAYFGWDDFVTDLRLTFLARNESMGGIARSAAEQFMIQHKIAFWYNINELVNLRHPQVMLEKFFSFALGIYTPTLILTSASIVFAILIWKWSPHSLIRPSLATQPTSIAKSTFARWLVGGFFASYAIVVITDADVAALFQRNTGIAETVILGIVTLIMIATLTNAFDRLTADGGAIRTAVLPLVTIGFAISWLAFTPPLYQSLTSYPEGLTPVWFAISDLTGPLLPRLLMLFAGWISMRISMEPPSSAISVTLEKLNRLIPVVGAGLAAYFFVFFLSPGYVMTGYLNRFVPFVTFVDLVPIAIAFAAMATMIVADLRRILNRPWWRSLWYQAPKQVRVRPHSFPFAVEGGLGLASIATLAMIPGYWIAVQITYLERLPPDQYGFMKLLSRPPYLNSTFVVNNYAAPISVATQNWAYYDALIGYERVEPNEGNIERDLRYLWLADRDTNPDYLKPDYFLCVVSQDIGTAIRPGKAAYDGCSKMPLIGAARSDSRELASADLMAIDISGRDRWAIARLNWSRSP
jgi:hypothetical protein